MIKVGLVGEDPNDTSSIKQLLQKRFPQIIFKQLARKSTGCQLDSQKFARALEVELRSEGFNFIIYIRDLDGFASEEKKVAHLHSWFQKLNNQFGNDGVFLLNVWELEALIFANIDIFNSRYKIVHRFSKDPAMLKDPKGMLKSLTRGNPKRYAESHCPDIFSHLDVDVIERNCSYFRQFLAEVKAAAVQH